MASEPKFPPMPTSIVAIGQKNFSLAGARIVNSEADEQRERAEKAEARVAELESHLAGVESLEKVNEAGYERRIAELEQTIANAIGSAFRSSASVSAVPKWKPKEGDQVRITMGARAGVEGTVRQVADLRIEVEVSGGRLWWVDLWGLEPCSSDTSFTAQQERELTDALVDMHVLPEIHRTNDVLLNNEIVAGPAVEDVEPDDALQAFIAASCDGNDESTAMHAVQYATAMMRRADQDMDKATSAQPFDFENKARAVLHPDGAVILRKGQDFETAVSHVAHALREAFAAGRGSPTDYPLAVWQSMTAQEAYAFLRARPVILEEWSAWNFSKGWSRSEVRPIARDGHQAHISVQPSTAGGWVIVGLDGYGESRPAASEEEAKRLADEGARAKGWKLIGDQRTDSATAAQVFDGLELRSSDDQADDDDA